MRASLRRSQRSGAPLDGPFEIRVHGSTISTPHVDSANDEMVAKCGLSLVDCNTVLPPIASPRAAPVNKFKRERR
jgi:hypothetical protein